jgi:hypothetical protein
MGDTLPTGVPKELSQDSSFFYRKTAYMSMGKRGKKAVHYER